MWLNSLVSALLLHLIAALEVGDYCRPTAELSDGKCTLLKDCEVARSILENSENHPYTRCGFQNDEEVLCCPRTLGVSKAVRECQKILDNENVAPPRSPNIIGGQVATVGEFPHMVALGFLWDDGYKFNCGGTLISDRYVVTAAHCIDGADGVQPTIARIGTVNVSDKNFNSQYDINIEKIVQHPEYKRRQTYHDICLIRLAKSVQWDSNKYPACLYTEQKAPNMSLIVTGWGVTNTTTRDKSSLLLKANVSLATLEDCRKEYRDAPRLRFGLSDNQLCAVDPERKRDICEGDSGGPLQGQTTSSDALYRLVGITSFEKGRCGAGIPAIYTRVSSYLNWIASVVWPN